MEEATLKACPTCGSNEVEIVIWNLLSGDSKLLVARGVCVECGLATREVGLAYGTIEERVSAAVVLWNRRAGEKEIEDLKAIISVKGAEIVQLQATSGEYPLPLTEEDAPWGVKAHDWLLALLAGAGARPSVTPWVELCAPRCGGDTIDITVKFKRPEKAGG